MLRISLSFLAIVAAAACSDYNANPAWPGDEGGSTVGDVWAPTNDSSAPGMDAPASLDSSAPMSNDSSAPPVADSGPVVPPVDAAPPAVPQGDAGLLPGVPPSKNFDLSVWSLTLPIGAAGNPTIITSAQLVAGYTSPYFFTGSDGAMTFWAPVTGVHTANSPYPRSELREDKNGAKYDWSLGGTSTLTAKVAVTTLPPGNQIVVGQIHGAGSQNLPLIELAYNAGSIEAQVIADPNVNHQVKTPVATGIGVGTVFEYSIRTTPSSMLTVSVDGKVGYQQAIGSNWSTQQFYFKAGDYIHANTGTSTQGGQVAFYALSIAHGP